MSTSSPLVSVVIPTYNAPHYLLETLQTVLDQAFTDFEVVIVNDGSTDDTLARVAPVARRDGRVRVVTQANAGIGAARNRGIDESRGKYVALLDHDDLWRPGKLAAQAAFMEANPACAACSCPWAWSTWPDQCTFDKSLICDAGGVVRRPLWHLSHGQLFLISASIFFDRQRARGLRYETRPKCIEDTPFQIGLFGRGAFGIAGDEILMTYRVHAANYSKQAAFFYNGQRMLREFTASGRFDELKPGDRQDLRYFLSHLGRTTAAKQLMGGYRLKALHAYLWELPHQLREARLKFLLSFPLLLMSPPAVVRRFLPGESV
jgi:glycosyltransferase involved in cell wall biosynthesis